MKFIKARRGPRFIPLCHRIVAVPFAWTGSLFTRDLLSLETTRKKRRRSFFFFFPFDVRSWNVRFCILSRGIFVEIWYISFVHTTSERRILLRGQFVFACDGKHQESEKMFESYVFVFFFFAQPVDLQLVKMSSAPSNDTVQRFI